MRAVAAAAGSAASTRLHGVTGRASGVAGRPAAPTRALVCAEWWWSRPSRWVFVSAWAPPRPRWPRPMRRLAATPLAPPAAASFGRRVTGDLGEPRLVYAWLLGAFTVAVFRKLDSIDPSDAPCPFLRARWRVLHLLGGPLLGRRYSLPVDRFLGPLRGSGHLGALLGSRDRPVDRHRAPWRARPGPVADTPHSRRPVHRAGVVPAGLVTRPEAGSTQPRRGSAETPGHPVETAIETESGTETARGTCREPGTRASCETPETNNLARRLARFLSLGLVVTRKLSSKPPPITSPDIDRLTPRTSCPGPHHLSRRPDSSPTRHRRYRRIAALTRANGAIMKSGNPLSNWPYVRRIHIHRSDTKVADMGTRCTGRCCEHEERTHD